jgi:hypothetical protein
MPPFFRPRRTRAKFHVGAIRSHGPYEAENCDVRFVGSSFCPDSSPGLSQKDKTAELLRFKMRRAILWWGLFRGLKPPANPEKQKQEQRQKQKQEQERLQVSPLRCASVEMTGWG